MNSHIKTILGKYEISMFNLIRIANFDSVYQCRIQGSDEWNLCVSQTRMIHKKYIESELEIAKKLSHFENENIVKIIDCCQKEQDVYIIMEKYDYELEKEFKNLQYKREWYKEEEIMDIIKQLLNGLYILNENNIIHRDIKQSNILVKVQDNKKKYKLSNFQLSKELEELEKVQDQTICGTMMFWSPQVQSSKYSAKCDIFSLGIQNWYRQIYEKTQRKKTLQFSFKQYKRYGSFFEQLLSSMIVYEEEDRKSLKEIFEMIIKEQCKQIFQIIQNKNEFCNLIMQQASQQGLLSDIDGKLFELNLLLYQQEQLTISFALFFVYLNNIPQYLIDSFHSNIELVIQSLNQLQNDPNYESFKIYTKKNYFLIKQRIDGTIRIIAKNEQNPQMKQIEQQYRNIKEQKNAFFQLKQQMENNSERQLKQLIQKLINFEEKYQLRNYLNFNPEQMLEDIK